MSREILFRAKKVEGGEWVDGYIVKKHGTYFLYDINNSDTCRQNNYLIDEDTICQYTGLTDMNGKKIFEGDIVRFGKNYGKVKFGLHESNWQIDKYNQGFFAKFPKVYFRNELGFWRDKVIVTGNIYDNPELLENGKENGTD